MSIHHVQLFVHIYKIYTNKRLKSFFLSSLTYDGVFVCLLPYSGGGEGSLDRLLPSVSTGISPRKRTTSQCKSEPPLLRTSKRTIYTAGRPPWYNEHGTQSKEAFVIGRSLKRNAEWYTVFCFLIVYFLVLSTLSPINMHCQTSEYSAVHVKTLF